MTGKREALRLYEVQAEPRKRQKQDEGNSLLYMSYMYADDVRVHEVVEFINQTMEREFSLSIGHDGAIMNYDADSNGWVLKAASPELADKACNLHGIYYNYQPLNIQKFGVPCSPARWCWNDYHLKRYGRNAHHVDFYIKATVLKSEASCGMDSLELQTALNDKMQEFKLATTNAIAKAVKVKSDDGSDSFLLCMGTESYASRLMYLNHISIDSCSITLNRLPEWSGEEPRYKHYGEFLKAYFSGEAKRAQLQKVSPRVREPDGGMKREKKLDRDLYLKRQAAGGGMKAGDLASQERNWNEAVSTLFERIMV